MPRGLKVFDVYGELHLDKDELRDAMRGLPGELGPDADRAGNELGKKMSDGLARAVEASSQRLVKARREESKATDAVKLAELRLSEARDKGTQKGSTLLALEQRLTQANQRLADSHNAVVKATSSHADAERRLAADIDDMARKALPNADRGGKDLGNKLSQGIHLSIVRNSPLIVAGVSAALIAGGPAMLTAATGLFAGIGIVAAAQSEKVRSAWTGTWDQVKAGAIADASVIEPVLVRVAGNVGKAFEQMRPQLRDAFSAAAPQIEVFTGGILKLAGNALPGLVRAVEAGMPVTRGFADFLAKTGTGLSDFFDRITAHAPAAGQVWSQLGNTMGTLLPMLGELIGQGAELGATVLPMLNGGLGLVLGAVEHLGGALPMVIGYFGAMKAINLVGGWASSAGAALTKLGAQDIPLVSAAAGKMGGALSTAGTVAAAGGVVVGALAATVGLLMAAHAASQERIRTWTQALNEGGAAAAAARSEMSQQDEQVRKATSGWQGFVTSMTPAGVALHEMAGETDAAKKANQDYLASLSPLENAQRTLGIMEERLSQAIKDHGAGSDQARAAADRYKTSQAEVARQEGLVEKAIHGVTQAMLDQANQALAAVDSGFAYQEATYRVADAQKALADARAHLNDADKNTRTTTDDVTRATTALGEALSAQAQAAGRAAGDASGLTDKMDLQKVTAAGTLQELYKLRDQYGADLPASLQTAIANLEATGVTLDWLGQKKPTPVVDANTDLLNVKYASAMNVLSILSGQRPNPIADLTNDPLNAKYAGAMNVLGILAGQRPTPVANLTSNSLHANYSSAMNVLGILSGQRPTPVAGLTDHASGGLQNILNLIGGVRDKTVTITTRHVDIGVSGRGTAGQAAGGNVGAAVRRAARGFVGGGAPRRRGDGRIEGPGGPFDDMVPAVTTTGEPLRVSPTEWIVNSIVSGMQGEQKMAALNAGQADIVVRGSAGRTRGSGVGAQSVDDVAAQLFDAMSTGVDQGIGGASPELTRSVMRAAPAVGAAVGSAAPRLGAAMTAASPAVTQAVAAAGPALTNAVAAAAGALGAAVRAAVPAAASTAGSLPTTPGPLPAGFGSQSYQFDESRMNDPAYMSWWNGLLAAGWRGTSTDGQERLYSPYARGGRFSADQLMKVGEQGEELVRFDRPGTVIPAPETRALLDGGRTVRIDNLVVKIETPLNLMNAQDLRRAGVAIRDVILKLEKEYA